MKVLVTGKDGFLGREIARYYKDEKNINFIYVGKQDVDLTDKESVEKLFKDNKFGLVIHTAIRGGRRTREDTADDFYKNLSMYFNIKEFYSGPLINFDSGASFDRKRDIYRVREQDLFKRYPSDYYGFSKNLIARDCINSYYKINFRIFNCFGRHETDDRLITANIINYIHKKPLQLFVDKEMDFFYVDDLLAILNKLVNEVNDNSFYRFSHNKDYNLCYPEKYHISDVLNIINSLSSYKCEIQGEVNKRSKMNYSGDGSYIKNSREVKIKGLHRGIEEMYGFIKNRFLGI